MSSSVISIQDVYFRYHSELPPALKGISLDVRKGEWLAIVGHNGSGKSTLAKMLNGLHFPQSGMVKVGEWLLNEQNIWEIRKRIGMVFQNPDNQFVGATVQDDVAFGLENYGIPFPEMKERIHHALRSVEMLDFLNQEPHHLSGGQKQRVAIAGIMALKPEIIILDESTSMLDPKGREEVIKTIRELNEQEQITIISITHDLEEARKADRLIILNEGEIFKEGTPEEIFQLDEELIQLGLDIPFAAKMSKSLKLKGLNIKHNYLTEEELVDDLWISHFKM
ncbi:energy-coupling factor ABC transporter ATP-binding protein [Bacillus spongiae]|uniref:Energy-coupling factor ABC transporter ATP-binding protein n=1 Tax=Bacillus spongiae TaxID=2683610 RepID=A0ABU8HJA0_9BACI